jgi:hypothetical protein
MRKRTGNIGMGDAERKARMTSIGGSDAKIIMSGDQGAIERLWREKRGEAEPENLDHVIIVNMGNLTEAYNLDLFEEATGLVVTDEQKKVFHPEWDKAHSTLDGIARKAEDGPAVAVVEAKWMLPFGFSVQAAIEKHFPQVQHNMMTTGIDVSYLTILTGGGSHFVARVEADLFYQIALLQHEKDFWECVETGKIPGNPVIEVPLAERVVIHDMTGNNEWADLAATVIATKTQAEKHDKAKKGLLKLFPADAAVAKGHGVSINLSAGGKRMMDIDKDEVLKADNDNGVLPAAKEEKKPTKPRAPRKSKATTADADVAA